MAKPSATLTHLESQSYASQEWLDEGCFLEDSTFMIADDMLILEATDAG